MRKATAGSLPPHHHHRFRGKIWSAANLTKPVAYVVLLLLAYSLGRYMAGVPLSCSGTTHSTHSQPSAAADAALISAPATKSSNDENYIHVQHNLPEPDPDLELEQGLGVPRNNDADIKFDDHNIFGPVCEADPDPNPNSKRVRQTIIDRVFNGVSPWENFPPPHATSLLRRNRVQGWGSTGAVFRNLIQKVKPKIIIEVGTFLGASALHMVDLTRQLGLRDTQILCVDDFRGWPGFQTDPWSRSDGIKLMNGDVMLLYQFMQNVVHANATESVIFLPFSTGSGLVKLCEWGVLGDLIEIDAGHDFHSAWSDINRAHKILRPGGILFGHDYLTAADNRGVRRAVDLFAKVKNLRVRVDGQHWVLHEH